MTKLFFNNPPNNPGTKTYTGSTASLAHLASENVNLTVAYAGLLCWVSANVLCQVRVYNTDSARAADTRDALTPVPPEGVPGLLAEVETETGSLVWSGAVPFVNAEVPQSKFLFLKVFNISGSAAAVSYTIKANIQHAYNSLPGEITADAVWGTITGTLSNQTDLQAALNAKLNASLLGANNGVATLDSSGKVPATQLTDIVITQTDIGLGNVDNTADLDKPISTATQTALDLKVNTSALGANNGVATLDSNGKLTATQLPALTITEALVFVVSATGVDAAVASNIPGILYMPYALSDVTVRMEIDTAPTGANLIVNMKWNGTNAMVDKFTIESSEFSTSTAATPPSLVSTSLALGTKITFDIEQVGATVKGRFIQVFLQGTRSL